MATDPIDVQLSENVTAALEGLEAFGVDPTGAMAAIASFLETETEFRFRSETAPDGTPWTKSLRVTGYTRADGEKVEGDGGQTLTLHGDLRRSMRKNWGADYAEAGPEASGGAAIYARIHQEGGRIVPKRSENNVLQKALRTPFGYRAAVVIPARPYLGWNAEMEDEVLFILGEHARQALNGGPAPAGAA